MAPKFGDHNYERARLTLMRIVASLAAKNAYLVRYDRQVETSSYRNMTMSKICTFVVLSLGFFISTADACTFSADLEGSWVESFRGRTLTFNSTHIEEYWLSDALLGDSFSCMMNSGNKYVAKSDSNHDVDLGNGLVITTYAYVCLEFFPLSANKQKYYIQTSNQVINNNQPIMRLNTDPAGMNVVCDVTLPKEQYYMMVKSGYENLTNTDFPGSLQGTYNYTVDGNCAESNLDNCADKTKITANLTQCANKIAYSANGAFHVLHYIAHNNLYYVSLYNLDTSGIDNVNYFQFICLAMGKSGNSVEATARGGYCVGGQNATAGGTQVLKLTAKNFCPPPIAPNPGGSIETTPKSAAFSVTINLATMLLVAISSSLSHML